MLITMCSVFVGENETFSLNFASPALIKMFVFIAMAKDKYYDVVLFFTP